MKSLLDTFSFLTLIRFKTKGNYDPAATVKHFSTVGLALGAGLVILNSLTQDLYFRPILMLIYLTAITGALHMDGFIDTADALFSHRSRERKLEIMKDPNTGAMGVVAVILLLLTKYSAFQHIENMAPLLLVPAYSRYAITFGIYHLPYVRKEGLGKGFFQNVSKNTFYQIIPAMLIMIILCGIKFTLIFHLVFFISVYSILKFYRFSIGGITGDLMGAMCELMEAILFTVSAVLLAS